MVNEKQGKVYEPTPIYNRKFIRNILRKMSIQKNGYHNVSKYMSNAFKRFQEYRKGLVVEGGEE